MGIVAFSHERSIVILMRQQLILPFLIIFLVVSVFGMYAMSAHAGHETGCAFLPSAIACETSLVAHIDHWQAAFVSILEILLLAALLFLRPQLLLGILPQLQRHHLDFRRTASHKPTLTQELFSRGIHNRKEPYHF